MLAALKAATAEGKATVVGSFTYKPVMAPIPVSRGWYQWNLQDAYNWYEPKLACVTKTVLLNEDGPVREVEVPMLEVGR